MNRAKKSIRSLAKPAAVESTDDGEVEEEDLDAPAPPLPAIEPPPSAELDGLSCEGWKSALGAIITRFTLAKDAVSEAKVNLAKEERKWQRVKETYTDSYTYSRHDAPSVVKRVEDRLMTADMELGKARAVLAQRTDAWLRLRGFCIWHRRRLLDVAAGRQDPLTEQFYQRALERAGKRAPLPEWSTMWPGLRTKYWDMSRKQYGLALTWSVEPDRYL